MTKEYFDTVNDMALLTYINHLEEENAKFKEQQIFLIAALKTKETIDQNSISTYDFEAIPNPKYGICRAYNTTVKEIDGCEFKPKETK
jgi:hypothetical protein